MGNGNGMRWCKWFFDDWDNDAALNLCSPGAQALWVKMLGIAFRHTPIGYVAINGKPAGANDLQKLIGWHDQPVAAWLAELESRGVFSRDEHGVIYSRRMVRDAAIHERQVEHGKKGGNPNIVKQKKKRIGLSQPLTQPLTPAFNPPVKATLKIEAEAEAESEAEASASKSEQTPAGATLGGYAPQAIPDTERQWRPAYYVEDWLGHRQVSEEEYEERRIAERAIRNADRIANENSAMARQDEIRRKAIERKNDPAWQAALKKYGAKKVSRLVLVNGDGDIPL